jgi:hypothetical protein
LKADEQMTDGYKKSDELYINTNHYHLFFEMRRGLLEDGILAGDLPGKGGELIESRERAECDPAGDSVEPALR